MVAGEEDATKLADLAVGLLRKKRDQLAQALSGKVNDHHRLMLRKLLGALKEREAENRRRRSRHPAADRALWQSRAGLDAATGR